MNTRSTFPLCRASSKWFSSVFNRIALRLWKRSLSLALHKAEHWLTHNGRDLENRYELRTKPIQTPEVEGSRGHSRRTICQKPWKCSSRSSKSRNVTLFPHSQPSRKIPANRYTLHKVWNRCRKRPSYHIGMYRSSPRARRARQKTGSHCKR